MCYIFSTICSGLPCSIMWNDWMQNFKSKIRSQNGMVHPWSRFQLQTKNKIYVHNPVSDSRFQNFFSIFKYNRYFDRRVSQPKTQHSWANLISAVLCFYPASTWSNTRVYSSTDKIMTINQVTNHESWWSWRTSGRESCYSSNQNWFWGCVRCFRVNSDQWGRDRGWAAFLWR